MVQLGNRRLPAATWGVLCVVVAGLSLVVLAACTSKRTAAACPQGAIVALGDSITFGTGLTRDEAYPARLAALLHEPVCNAGVPGDQAGDALGRLQRDVLQYHPRAVVILLGANDAGFLGEPTDPEVFRHELTQIVAKVADSGAVPVVASLLPVDPVALRREWAIPDGWPIYDRIVREVAAAKQTAIVDLTAAVGGDLTLLADGLHPSAAGSEVIAAAVAKVLTADGI